MVSGGTRVVLYEMSISGEEASGGTALLEVLLKQRTYSTGAMQGAEQSRAEQSRAVRRPPGPALGPQGLASKFRTSPEFRHADPDLTRRSAMVKQTLKVP
eukprot:766501-Hanusia_phi.AAC.1